METTVMRSAAVEWPRYEITQTPELEHVLSHLDPMPN